MDAQHVIWCHVDTANRTALGLIAYTKALLTRLAQQAGVGVAATMLGYFRLPADLQRQMQHLVLPQMQHLPMNQLWHHLQMLQLLCPPLNQLRHHLQMNQLRHHLQTHPPRGHLQMSQLLHQVLLPQCPLKDQLLPLQHQLV